MFGDVDCQRGYGEECSPIAPRVMSHLILIRAINYWLIAVGSKDGTVERVGLS